MNSDWIFVSNRMGITKGMKILAKNNGTLGITSVGELFLYNDNGVVIDRAPFAHVVVNLGSFAGDSVQMNGNKYNLNFIVEETSKFKVGYLFGAIGGLAEGMKQAQMLETCAKRNEFKALVERTHGHV